MRNVKMKQNKNTSAVRVASATLAAFVLLFSFCVPSFAYTDTSSNGIDFSNQPLPVAASDSWSDVKAVGISAGTYFNGTVYWETYLASSPNVSADVYAFFIGSSDSIQFASETENAVGRFVIYYDATSHYAYSGICNTYDSTTGLYYGYFSISSPYSMTTKELPIFTDRPTALAAVRDWIDNPGGGGSVSPHPVSFSLQPGYVAFVDISNLTGVSTNLATSVFGAAEWSPRVTDQSIGIVSSVPASFSIPISGTSRISWIGSGSKNVLGQYKNFGYSYNASAVGGSSYICIVNPLQASQSGQLTAMASMPSARNNPISVSISSARNVKIYSLTASMALGSGNLDTESDGQTWSGSPDENGQWSFSNDQTGSPTDIDSLPVGGGNDPIIGETSINDWLQEIANSIKGFFAGAIGAVTTLVSAGSDFMHELMGLYSWLPAPVYAVLTSALILVITIGVIKVFI